MTIAERREAARLRSERWRRAHGIMPRRPAQRPWLAGPQFEFQQWVASGYSLKPPEAIRLSGILLRW